MKMSETFNWKDDVIQVVKSYTYLGIIFSSSGTFERAASSATKQGLAAVGATLTALKRTKIFNLGSVNLLFNSIVKSTTLYGAGIWGWDHSQNVERVQQQYYKRILNLPTCKPRYFIRLETGRPPLSLEVAKFGLDMLQRILK